MSLFAKSNELLDLAHKLGDPAQSMAILGEGNVSCRLDEESFLVKATGSELRSLSDTQLTQVSFAQALAFMDATDLSDAAVKQCLADCRADSDMPRPSVETFMHAVCLTTGKADWVGHTHPEAVNSILCSQAGLAGSLGPIYPDQIVVCGRHWLVVPYVDPGVQLALLIREKLEGFVSEYGAAPKLILLENHGAVALGSSAREVANILQMANKWARIVIGAYAMGGPKFMDTKDADRINGRDDEQIRRRALGMS